MALSKERKIYLGILGVAGLAVTIDLLLPSPKAASAGAQGALSSATDPNALPPSGSESPPLGLSSSAIVSISLALDALGARMRLEDGVVADAFAPSMSWAAPVDPENELGHPSASDIAQVFVNQHSLTAVLDSRNGAGAVVDGVFLRMGDRLGGFVLVAVGEGSAVFQSGQAVAILEIESIGRKVIGAREQGLTDSAQSDPPLRLPG